MRPHVWLCTALLFCACQDLSDLDSDLELEEADLALELGDPAHVAYVKAPNPNAVNAFGFDIAIDGETLLIGATHERSRTGDPNDDSGLDNGAAYVRVRNGGTWSHQAYFKASPIMDFQYFGTSVAIDENTAVVGDRTRGAVNVFERSGTVWTRTAILRPPPDQAPRRFGENVAVSGNLIAISDTGDASRARGVGGNPGNLDAPFSGAVWVYRRKGNWTLDAYIKASNSEAFDFFGTDLVLSGNMLAVVSQDDSNATGVDGDQTNNAADQAGAVFVFERSGGRWTQRAYLKASNTEARDAFGSGLALAGDTLAVGAALEDSDATGVDGDQQSNATESSGAVYVFRRAGASWSQEAYIKASNPDVFDLFGGDLALFGDRLAVGAFREASSAVGIDGDQLDNSAEASGAVYLFEREGTSWSQAHYVKASNTDPGDQFGVSLAMDDQRLVVGATGEASCAAAVGGNQADNRCPGKGALYIIE
jgi:hypothetical protein